MPGVFGSDGPVTAHQASITSLSIVSDAACAWESGYWKADHYLNKLTEFRHLSWIGLCPGYEIEDLRDLFKTVAQNLESLELEMSLSLDANIFQFIDWGVQRVMSALGSPLTHAMFGGPYMGQQVEHSSLRSLSFSYVDFRKHAKTFIDAINFDILQSLKLHECEGLAELLSQTPSDFYLEVLHATANDRYKQIYHTVFTEFLSKTRELRELCILLHSGMQSQLYWATFLRYTSTLECLVYHERQRYTIHNYVYINRDLDFLEKKEDDTYQVPSYTIPTLNQSFSQLLEDGRLAYFAVCASSKLLIQSPISSNAVCTDISKR